MLTSATAPVDAQALAVTLRTAIDAAEFRSPGIAVALRVLVGALIVSVVGCTTVPETVPEEVVTTTPSEPAISETIPVKTLVTKASEPVAAAPASERTISLTWDSSKESVQGYRIFMGPTADAASMRAIEELEAQAGSQQTVSLIVSELGVKLGEEICFRVQAFRSAEVSDYSEALCHTP